MGHQQDSLTLREEMLAACQWLSRNGFNQLTSGNLSVRWSPAVQGDASTDRCGSAQGMWITPSGIDYELLQPDQLIWLPLDFDDRPSGDSMSDSGVDPLANRQTPSSEWRLHRDILRARPEINAVVHTHSIFATSVAVSRQSIPAAHYLIAAFGGEEIRCAPYARFGTDDLSRGAVEALQDRMACLLSNHGVVAIGKNLKSALWFAVQLETLAQQFLYSQSLGGPVLLTPGQVAETAEAMQGYLKDKD